MDFLFLSILSAILYSMLFWGIKTLPGEKWQIIASIPVSKDEDGTWQGINLTYYGLLTANANFIAIFIFLSLLGALDIPLSWTLVFSSVILLICIPSARLIAIIVEKKRYTFTIGGASFTGILIAPWIIIAINILSSFKSIPVLPVLSAMAISYSIGEGMGRLACISFGCCYGKPLSDCSPIIQRIFKRFHLVFSGDTKKVSYESGLSGKKLVPVQAITSILYVTAGIASIFLFLKTYFMGAFVLAMTVTQLWRAFSEFLRADYRGEKSISAYQIMAVVAVFYAVAISLLLPIPQDREVLNIIRGLSSLWNPQVILFLLTIWLSVFLYTGKSMVTAATLSLKVVRERI